MNKTMKKILLFLAFVVNVFVANADEYPYLAFQTVDGSVATVSTTGLTISYAEGVLTAQNSVGETRSFETSNLSLMYFTDTATGIATIDAQGQPVSVEIVAADGRNLGRYDSLKDAADRLPKGVYIVKANGKTVKIALK